VLSPDAEKAIAEGEWSGNVRELANALERAAIVCESREVTSADLDPVPVWRSKASRGPRAGFELSSETAGVATLESMERRAIESALASVEGNRRKAAELLGIGLRTLYDKLKRYGL
jgi:two-component system response regulator FlrC